MATTLELFPSDASLWLEFGGIYAAPEIGNLHSDGNMEAAGIVDWIAFRAAVSKQVGAPHSGTQCLRVAYDGVNADGMAYKAILTIGERYVVSGWARSSGTAIPRVSDGAAHRWIGTTSTDWQYFSVEFVSGGTQFQLRSLNLAPGLYVEFDDIIVQKYISVIDNLATRGDAPARVTCGAGAACPTQLSGRRGVSFDGGDYIDCGLVDRFERTDAFTLFVCTSLATYAGSSDLISNINVADASKGFNLKYGASEAFEAFLVNTVAGNNYIATASTSARRTCQTVCSTYNGSALAAGVSLFRNGALASKTVNNDTLTQTIKNGKPILVGARHNGSNKSGQFEGTMHFAAIFPLAASPLQISNLHKRVMRRINLP